MNKRAKLIKFVDSNKKQIIFALFALLYILDSNSAKELYKAAAPAAAAAAAKAAEAAKAAKTAKATADAAKAAKAAEEAARAAKTAEEAAKATKTTEEVTGAAKTQSNVPNVTKVSNRGVKSISKNIANDGMETPNINGNKNNLLRNKNPNPNDYSNIEKDKIGNGLTDNLESSDNRFKDRRIRLRRKKKEDEEETKNNFGMESAYDTLSKGGPFKKIGCGLFLFFAIILMIPIMFFSEISNTVTATTFLNNIVDEAGDVSDFFKNLYEKFENGLKYHYFASNKDAFNQKINDTYQKIYKEYGIPIDIPLLLSTLLSDYNSLIPEINDNNESIINKETMRKLDYAEDLARMQISESNEIYLCSSREVDGKTVYYQVIYSGSVDDSMIASGNCNASNVGKYIKGHSSKVDSDEYFEKLQDNVILTLLYPDYEGSTNLIVDKIKSQYQIYDLLYMNSNDESDEYNIPSDLLYDTEINMQAPLKGKITITSPFGGRGDVYRDGQIISSGAHYGIDIYSSDRSIYSAGNGTVYRTYYESSGGNIVEILHTTVSGKRYISQYAHLSQILVSKNDEIKAGDLIAIMGCTGSACNGPHLHFGIKDLDSNEWLNPKAIVQRTIN